jgi:hypothetical protein
MQLKRYVGTAGLEVTTTPAFPVVDREDGWYVVEVPDVAGELVWHVPGKLDVAVEYKPDVTALEATLQTVLSAVQVLGTGIEGVEWGYLVRVGGIPTAGAWVEVYRDAARSQLFRQGLTGADGYVTFKMPLPQRSYYLSIHVSGREVFYDQEVAP